jgi:hypothetical protein
MARPRRRYTNKLPDAETRDTFSQCGNGTCHLMAENHGLAQDNGTKTTVIVIVKIRSADTTGFNLHHNFTIARQIRSAIFDT